MSQYKRLHTLLIVSTILVITTCAGCSGRLEEGDATQLALDEVNRSYSDSEQIVSEVTSSKRRADSGLTVQISATLAEGNVAANLHEVDVTPDGTVVGHTMNGQDVPSEDEEQN